MTTPPICTSDSPSVASGIAMIAAGALFLAYPLIRGFRPEDGPAGAETFSSSSWTAAHLCAMAGFVVIAVSLRFLSGASPSLELTSWLAAAFLLPYYGAEAFGGAAVGRWAHDNTDFGSLEIVDEFRFSPVPAITFLIGWILLAAVGIALIRRAIQASGSITSRAGTAVTGVGMTLFLPVFFTPGSIRITHGIVMAVGLIMWGASLLAARNPGPAVPSHDRPTTRSLAS